MTGGGTLTFTPQNWSTAQNVTITADDSGTGQATFTSSANGYAAARVTATEVATGGGTYTERFLDQYNKIKDPANGYFSPEGIPYHSVETFMVEAPTTGTRPRPRPTATSSGWRPCTARSRRTGTPSTPPGR